jgi:toxin ParE1/3/4
MASFEFLPEAEAEFIEQIAYYAGIRRELGLRFQESVAQAITEASVNPDHGAPRTQNTRRRLVKGFPFGVIYATRGQGILIVAIADGRRRPDYWVRRVN